MIFPPDFYQYIRNHNLIEIKGGVDRDTFLEIWMVEVGQRVFARSWTKSERSWFTEIIKTGIGQVKYGDKIIDISGTKLAGDDEIHHSINRRYLEKYDQEENVFYAKGITQPEYADYTMEFFLLSRS